MLLCNNLSKKTKIMPKITAKHPEVIQAQIAEFTSSRVEHFKDSDFIFDNIGRLSTGEALDVVKITESPEYHRDENGETVRITEGTERTVATVVDYVDFLRSVGGSKSEVIKKRAEILKAYEHFAPIVSALKAELSDPASRSEHSSFIGKGSNAAVFSIHDGGRKYAVRVPKSSRTSPASIEGHVAGAVLGQGVPHLEQIVAASYEDGVTVAEIMPGKEVGRLSVDEIRSITDEQLSDLVDTIVAARERDIEIDPKVSNFFYDQYAGFGIVDYHSAKVVGRSSSDQELGEVVSWIATTLDNAGFSGKPSNTNMTIEDYASDLEYKKANVDVLNRYRNVVLEKLRGSARQTALQGISVKINVTQEQVNNYSNSKWVAECLVASEKWHQQQAEKANMKNPSGELSITLENV